MADIRINGLPAEASPVATDVVPIDGATTRKTTIQDLVLVGRPTASQAEAEAGTNPTKVMTPLTTKQAVDFYGLTKAGNLAGLADKPTARSNLDLGNSATLSVGTTAGTVAAGDDSRIVNAVQTARAVNTGSGLTGGGDLSADRTISLAASDTVRDILDVPVYVADRTVMKALDTTKDVISYLLEGDRQGAFKWTAGNFSTQIAADTAEGIYVKANAIAASAGAWVRVFDGRVFARWFGTGQAAIQAANAMADDITIDRDFAITSTATWANGKNYMFIGVGKLSVATAVTLTIRGVVHAGIWQGLPTSAPRKIFDCTGTGKVLGVRYVKPEWWGALGDVTGGAGTDDKAALQAAHDCVEGSFTSDGGRPEVELRGGANYGLASQLTLRPTANINLKFTGAGPIFGGSRFTALASFSTGSGTAAIRIDGNSDSLQKIAAFDIGNFAIIRTSGASLVGLWVGGNGTTTELIGVQQSSIHDVYVDNFSFGYRIANCRLIDFNRCSAWCQNVSSSVGCYVTVDSNTAFTGDMNFNDCQFVGDFNNTNKCFSITNTVTVGGGSGNGELKGIRFNNCIFYKADRYLEIYAATGGHVGDIWINPGCQFDGFGNVPIYIESNGSTSVIDSIHILSSYFRGINATKFAMDIKATSSGKLRDVHIRGNQIFSLGASARAIAIDGLIGGTIDENKVTDMNFAAGEAILISNSSRFSVNGNKLSSSTGATTVSWFVTVGSGCDHYTMQSNIAGGGATTAPTRNLSGVTTAITNNI